MTNLSGANLNNGVAVGPQGEGRESPSSFPAYPVYRSSGVEWLGVVPEHWALGSLKHLAWIRNGRDYKEVESPDGEYPVIGSGGQFANATRYLYDGESVLLGRKGTIDKPLYIHGRFWTVDTMFYTEVAADASARFLYYNALTIPFQYYSTSTALPSMTQGDLMNHPCAIPALEEQTQIARFLDHETARIDALIEEQQRLIELLKEKRQAVISHAVTKGLDPTVPMKDSGVEWLGEVPAHWTIKKGGHIGMLFGSEAVPEDMVNVYGNLPFLKVGSLSADTLSIRQWDFFVDESIERFYRPKKRFIVFPKRGAAIFLNKVNVVEVSALLDPNLMGWEMQAGNNAYYFANVLKCRGLSELADVSTVPQINNKHISPEKFPVPPSAEQNGVVAFLDIEVSRFDQLVTEAEHGVSLLQERRSALISAAVTGKIDVRDWQPPVSAQSPESVREAV